MQIIGPAALAGDIKYLTDCACMKILVLHRSCSPHNAMHSPSSYNTSTRAVSDLQSQHPRARSTRGWTDCKSDTAK